MKKHHIDWQSVADVPIFKPLMIFLFFIIASSNCGGAPDIQTDQIWSQMTEEQKREAILNYYQQQQMMSQSQPNQSTEPQCPDISSNALRDELMKLEAENARLQQKLHKDEVVFLPPAF
jgi:hypothetical protein